MGAEDDPKHPLYPAFDNLDSLPPKSWMVLYEGLSGRWLATHPFYHHESAIKMGSQFDRGVRIVELTVTDVEDLPMDVRLKHRKKTKKVRPVVAPPTAKRVRKVRRVVEEDEEE